MPRWPGFPHFGARLVTCPSSSRPGSSAPRSASRWKTRGRPRGSSGATIVRVVTPGHADRRRPAPTPGRPITWSPSSRSEGQARPWPGPSCRRAGSSSDGRVEDRVRRRDRAARPGRGDRLGDGAGSPLGADRCAAVLGPGPDGATILGLPARAGPLRALLRPFPGTTMMAGFGVDDQSARTSRPPAPWSPISGRRRRRPSATSTRLTPYRTRRGRPGPRRDDPPQPRTDAHPARGEAAKGRCSTPIDRTCTAMGARLHGRLAHLAADRVAAGSSSSSRRGGRADRRGLAARRPTSARRSGGANDLERLAARIGTGRATPRDLVALARTLVDPPRD